MTKQLILRIDSTWPTQPLARWVLLGENLQVLSSGESEARHWPAADSCSVLLAGGQCVWLEVVLPKAKQRWADDFVRQAQIWQKVVLPRAARRDEPGLLAYALEDRLLDDSEQEHLTLSHRRSNTQDGGESQGIVLVDRERLRLVLAQLAASGRVPLRLCSEFPATPEADSWQIMIDGEEVVLLAGPGNAAVFCADLLPQVLAQQLAFARLNALAPKMVRLHLAPGAKAPENLAELCGDVELRLGAPHVWWLPVAQELSVDLLHDEFAPTSRSEFLNHFKWPLWLASGAFALWLLGGLGEVLWSRHTLDGLNGRMERTYLSVFPNSLAVAPAEQMQQQLSLERGKHGQLRNDDPLALLARVVDVLGADATNNIGELHFSDGLLELSLKGALAGQVASFQPRFASSGLLTDIRDENGGVRLRVRLGELP
jgi:general secretion pathway protein L